MKTLKTQKNTLIVEAIQKLKSNSGSHSPSLLTLTDNIPQLEIKVDACFLSNPYATELFLKYFDRDLIKSNKIKFVLQNYPSQNRRIADILSSRLEVSTENLFIGNGATEIIQAAIHNFVDRKIVVNIPTFSAYYEFVQPGVEVVYYSLSKHNNYRLEVKAYLDFIRKEKPDSVVLINPNNPDGGYIRFEDIKYILGELKDVKTIILDESFIHFAIEENDRFKSAAKLIETFSNLIVVKSMSKDFGIAGIRAGYGVMHSAKVDRLLKNGYLWNLSGLAEYFFQIYSQDNFWNKYEKTRVKYIHKTRKFIHSLSQIEGIRTYPSWANFALIELVDGSKSFDVFSRLLVEHGVYTRSCSDKIGLDGEFIRIAARNKKENARILNSLKQLFPHTKKSTLEGDLVYDKC